MSPYCNFCLFANFSRAYLLFRKQSDIGTVRRTELEQDNNWVVEWLRGMAHVNIRVGVAHPGATGFGSTAQLGVGEGAQAFCESLDAIPLTPRAGPSSTD